jgi:hypothetical protein
MEKSAPELGKRNPLRGLLTAFRTLPLHRYRPNWARHVSPGRFWVSFSPLRRDHGCFRVIEEAAELMEDPAIYWICQPAELHASIRSSHTETMTQQTPLLVQLAPSIIAAIALTFGAILTYVLTTRLESRKWLRLERYKAYEGYVAYLRKFQFQEGHDLIITTEELYTVASHIDHIRIVGSDQIVRLVEAQYDAFPDKFADQKSARVHYQRCLDEFRVHARADLGTSRKVR